MKLITLLLLSIAILTNWPVSSQNGLQPTKPSASFDEIGRMLPPTCTFCHGWDDKAKKTGLFMDTYAGLLDGAFHDGKFHPVIIPGDAEHSPFVEYIEGRRKPRMPYGREPLSDEDIQQIRRWIDNGAKPGESTSKEHKVALDHIPVDSNHDSFWLSCRAPRNEQNIGLRVKVVDESSENTVSYDWPTDEKDLNGRWSQWQMKIPKGSMKFPGTISVILYVSSGWPTQQMSNDDDDLDGVIFLLEPNQTSEKELLKQKDLRSIPQPKSPPYKSMRFTYVLRAPSNLTLTVWPEGETKTLFRWEDKDLPANRTLETIWNIEASPGAKTGWHCARLMCMSRDPKVFQPDMAVLFRIVR